MEAAGHRSKRDQILDALRILREIKDPDGRCVRILWEYLEQPGTLASFGTTIWQLSSAGLIERDVEKKQTFALRLTKAGEERLAPRAPEPEPSAPEPAPAPPVIATNGEGKIDYDILANRLLDRVMRKLHEEPGLHVKVRDLEHQVAELSQSLTLARQAQEAAEVRVKNLSVELHRSDERLREMTMERNTAMASIRKVKSTLRDRNEQLRTYQAFELMDEKSRHNLMSLMKAPGSAKANDVAQR